MSAEPTEESTHTHNSPKAVGGCVHLAKSDSEKFWSSFFKSLRGQEGQSPRKNGAFLFAKLFLLSLRNQKKKRYNDG